MALAIIASAAADAAEGPLNSSPPSITGTARDAQHLKANKGSWAGARPISYSYQWTRCDASGSECGEIGSARKGSYKAGHADVGHTLRVVVSASDAGGKTSVTSAQSELVAPAALSKGKLPKISGSATDGRLLSVGSGTWKGTPPSSFTYRWEACGSAGVCEAIPGASSSSYRVASPQLGKKLRVLVTATNDAGSVSDTSRATKKILAGSPVNTAPPSVSGSLQEGQTLTAASGTWAGTGPIAFGYQWQRCSVAGGGCEPIADATAPTYELGLSDLASNIAVLVTASNAEGSVTSSSPETQAVLGILPTNTVLPTISGLLQDGQLLSVATGSWSGTSPITYAYQWQLCGPLGAACENISNATGPGLSLDPSEIGSTLAVVVTATNAAGSSSATTPISGLISGILPSNSSLPSISGALLDGQLLSGVTGTWSGSQPISYAYQWQLCNAAGTGCKNISEALESNIKLSPADVGSTLRLLVTATNAAGSSSASSAASGLISAILPSSSSLPAISGLLQTGQLLSATTGVWSGTAPISYSYEWQLCNTLGGGCAGIAKATESTLKLSLADLGLTLRVIVTASNAAGSVPAASSVTSLILGIL
jgi:hypothetical protein